MDNVTSQKTESTQPFKVRTGCGHVVIRRMREATAGVPYTEDTILEAPNGRPCPECEAKTALAFHRLELVTGNPIRLHCIACGRELSNVEQHHPNLPRAYADLDGKPFVDYYDAECAIAKGAKL